MGRLRDAGTKSPAGRELAPSVETKTVSRRVRCEGMTLPEDPGDGDGESSRLRNAYGIET